MSGGGTPDKTTQTNVSEPWSGSQPYMRDIFSQAAQLSSQPASYYPGATTVGPLQSEQNAFQQQAGYNNSVFAGQPSLQYGDVTGAVGGALNGTSQLGQMAGTLAPDATQAIQQGFQAPNTSGVLGVNTNPSQIGQYGFGTSLDPNGKAPTFGVAGGLDARGAYQQMLSGQPDYAGTQGAIDAANAPILRQLNEQILPQLNQQATFNNNATGGVKALNRVLPEIGQRMTENAQNINNQERIRALSAQQSAAQQVSQGGMQGYGLGLQTAQGERGLEQNLAGLGLQTDQSRAQYGLQGAGLGLQQQGMAMDANSQYRGDLLNYGSLAGQLSGQAGSQSLAGAGLAPSIYDMGRQPSQDALGYANYDRALQEDQLGADMDKFNYLRDQPYNQLQFYNSMIQNPGGTTIQTGPGQRQPSRAGQAVGGALAGAATGAQMGSSTGPWGAIIGGILGGASAYI